MNKIKEGRDPSRPMERPEETNIWNNPNEILIDDNVDPEKNADEIDLSDDDDACFKEEKEEIKEEIKEENQSDSDSDDGAPQARPFILPFSLPPPTKSDTTSHKGTILPQGHIVHLYYRIREE